MLILRFLGNISFLAAIVALVYDGTKSLGEGALSMTPLGQHWFNLSPGTLSLAQSAIEKHVSPALWDPVVVTILLAPAWVVFGVTGLILHIIGRKRTRLNVFVN